MNNVSSTLFAAAMIMIASVSFANTNTNAALSAVDQKIQLENVTGNAYSLSVLAIYPDGNRAYMSGNYSAFHMAYMAYQAFSFDLPERAEVVYAQIVDRDGNVIFSLN